jgi:hypothetical protein
MLTPEENEMLTRVGPGTPAGELLRRYWHPVAIAEPEDNPQSLSDLAKIGAWLRTKAGHEDHCRTAAS